MSGSESEKPAKRRFETLQSPEKKSEAAGIAEALHKLNEGLLDSDQTSSLVTKIQEFIGDTYYDETVRRLDQMTDILSSTATKTQIQQLEGQITILSQELHEKDVELANIRQAVDDKESEILLLKNQNDNFEKRIRELENFAGNIQLNQKNSRNHAINNEQYQRKSNLTVYGVKEGGRDEDCKKKAAEVMAHCNGDVLSADIDVAHRIGPVGTKPRPIIARMGSHDVRWKILTARKALKGVKENGVSLSIGEDVTKEYQELINTIKTAGNNCWFWNGRVWIQRSDGSSIPVQIQDNWELKLNDLNVKGRPPKGNQRTTTTR